MIGEEELTKLQKLVDKWQAASFGNATDPVKIAEKLIFRDCADALAGVIGAPHKVEEE